MEEDKSKKCNQHQGRQFLSEHLLFLILTLIFIFTPDIYIGSKYQLSVYLVCNNQRCQVTKYKYFVTLLK